MDCSILPTRVPGVVNVTTTDFFYPLVEEPYTQGRISCANVISDMYAVGVTEIDNMLMILAASTDIPVEFRDVVTMEMIRGFNDLASEAGTKVTGGQSVLNPWPMLGGVAQSIVMEESVLTPDGAVPGDVLVLTKPLGMQVVVNLHQWLDDPEKWQAVDQVISREDAIRAYNVSSACMHRLNRFAASLFPKYQAHAATDVTGFGILGHASNLAQNQKQAVDFNITCLPVIAGMMDVNNAVREGERFKLKKGYAAETSGGLLVCLPEGMAEGYCNEIFKEEGWRAFVIGRVVEGTRVARIVDDVEVLNV